MRNAQHRTWNIARELKNVEKEKRTLQDLEYGKKTEITENEKYTLYDMKYGEEN